jgi:hypothetical protein
MAMTILGFLSQWPLFNPFQYCKDGGSLWYQRRKEREGEERKEEEEDIHVALCGWLWWSSKQQQQQQQGLNDFKGTTIEVRSAPKWQSHAVSIRFAVCLSWRAKE